MAVPVSPAAHFRLAALALASKILAALESERRSELFAARLTRSIISQPEASAAIKSLPLACVASATANADEYTGGLK